MNKASICRLPAASAALLGLLLGVTVGAANAQSSDPSAGSFGDRQSGHWGDPGEGHFGNPATGDFDSSRLKVPPQGVRPMGKVIDKNNKPIEPSPYITLPAPVEQAAKASEVKKAAPKKKKRAAKKAASN